MRFGETKSKYLEGIFKQKAVLHSTIRLGDKAPALDSLNKFKRNLNIVPYVEPTLTNFLEKEESRLRRESQTLIFHGEVNSTF